MILYCGDHDVQFDTDNDIDTHRFCHDTEGKPFTSVGWERDRHIKRWESEGRLDPECPFCKSEFYAKTRTFPQDVFAPNHTASSRCESGKRSHCTCDTCF